MVDLGFSICSMMYLTKSGMNNIFEIIIQLNTMYMCILCCTEGLLFLVLKETLKNFTFMIVNTL